MKFATTTASGVPQIDALKIIAGEPIQFNVINLLNAEILMILIYSVPTITVHFQVPYIYVKPKEMITFFAMNLRRVLQKVIEMFCKI